MLRIPEPSTSRPNSQLFAEPGTLFDEDGFVVDHEHWNEALAERIARREGVGALDERHWKLLHHVRERYLALGGMPGMRRVCKATGMSREEIYDLFGGCLPVWRIAGLPNPGEEAKTYLD
ncbi:TusE/DsrC/DsvC family sulfur relay protein [Thioalkalivibrio nitratireducens DSM 14787]|uniref:TusE/DsrC/DsvC family sulfur relay protein n=1 Tax=Thioalkalivibrio nitratireducens (strain DSM 14787 / UNIQEM 213 / ALEN2) TaxID=1255043 RepID=L0DT41_THIND|nr:TusE/DsrC/DsvC family sulfur relay protein [Thioalkalivibrio nitratireducens]AGA32155.1 TusE/DsrC/DsvC family sulfur relay protein [Thioalkalivibrio nitratireducens DSM 14787]